MSLEMNRDQILDNMQKMTPTEKGNAIELLSKLGVDLTEVNNELTGSRVVGFVFNTKVYEADSHKDIFLKVIGMVLRNHKEDQDRILKVKGPKRVYFSKSVKDFPHGYERINGTDFYAGTNENAKTLNQRCQKVLALYGIDPSSLNILTR